MARPIIQVDLAKLKSLYTGLGQVSLRFGEALARLNNREFDLVYLVPKNFAGFFGKDVRYEPLTNRRRYFPFFCAEVDLWHATHQDSPWFPSSRKTPTLLTIHDLNFLDEKSPAKAKRRLKSLQQKVDRADVITCISEYTRSVVRENLQIGERPVHVIHNGVSLPMEPSRERPGFMPAGKFFFAMGVIKQKKNFHVLVELMRRMPEYSLIMAGDDSGSYAASIRESIQDAGLVDRVILPGIISDSDRAWLYTNCEAFLFPSKVEGFGLPVVEAMLFGAPVYSSRYASLTEVGGDLARYWESFDPEHMAELIHQTLSDEQASARREARKVYAQTFSWEKNAEAYLEFYRQMLR